MIKQEIIKVRLMMELEYPNGIRKLTQIPEMLLGPSFYDPNTGGYDQAELISESFPQDEPEPFNFGMSRRPYLTEPQMMRMTLTGLLVPTFDDKHGQYTHIERQSDPSKPDTVENNATFFKKWDKLIYKECDMFWVSFTIALLFTLLLSYVNSRISVRCYCGRSNFFFAARHFAMPYYWRDTATWLVWMSFNIVCFGFLSSVLIISVPVVWNLIKIYIHEKDKIKKAAKALGKVVVLSNGRLGVSKG